MKCHRAAVALLAAVLAILLTACEVEESGGEKIKEDKSGAASTKDAPEEDAPRVREAPDADGRFSSSCDILLSSELYGQNYFVGSAKMRNTGNVGIVVRVRARFDQVASENVTDEKTVRLDVGQRRTAKFRIPASNEQISEHQSSPDYFNGEGCKLTAKVVDSYGKPPFEEE